MAAIGLSEAAKLTGRNPSTIHRAMTRGTLSFTLGPNGERLIDPAELARVFSNRVNGRAIAQATKSHSAQEGEIAALQRLLDDREATIRDLRARLDLEAEERRRLSERIHGLLTAQTIEVSQNEAGRKSYEREISNPDPAQIVTAFDLWFPKDHRQRVLWPSTLRLSLDYFQSLKAHAVPLDERALAALSHSALGLDLYAWLAQRAAPNPETAPAIHSLGCAQRPVRAEL